MEVGDARIDTTIHITAPMVISCALIHVHSYKGLLLVCHLTLAIPRLRYVRQRLPHL